MGLNPHVVGRFFRVSVGTLKPTKMVTVLIPMWWGGFSEGLEPIFPDVKQS